jgi:acylphosphatase
MATLDHIRLHATVEGRVQGVSFRYFVSENANRLGISGWVRNRWSGSVEVLAEGERNSLEVLLAALRQGPRAAFVSGVQFEWQQASGEFTSFRTRMTA